MSVADPRPLFSLDGLDLSGFRSPSGETGLEVTLVTGRTVCRIMPLRGQLGAVGAALKPFGFEALPAAGQSEIAGGNRLSWADKNCWHLVTDSSNNALEATLKEALKGLAAVSDASDGLLCLAIKGEASQDVMAKGCVLDLDRIETGQSAVTLMAHTRVFLCRTSADGFELMIPASHAASFWEWLCLSAAEFGMGVVASEST